MSQLHLLPADSLAAAHDFQTQQLFIEAKGKVNAGVYDIHFSRVQWLGGLKFELLGWGGEPSLAEEPYEIVNKFDIILPSPVYPSDSIIIIDANHPKGVIVPIRFLSSQGLSEPTKVSDLEPANLDTSNIKIQAGNVERINAPLREPFQIKALADVPKQGSVSIKFDKSFIEIQDATIQDKDLVWVLNSLRTGNTQIIVTTSGGIAQFVIVKTYNVRIFVLDNVTSGESKTDDGIKLPWIANVEIAERKVRAKYPHAGLIGVEGNSPTFVDSSESVKNYKATFTVGLGSVTTTQTEWGEWTSPVYHPGRAPIGLQIIHLSKLKFQPSKTDELVKEAGWKLEFNRLNLYYPLVNPELKEQPRYEYSLKGDTSVRVNAINGQVDPPHPE